MIIALLAAAIDGDDMDRLSKAAAACDRPAISRAWDDEVKRHSEFMMVSLRDQAAITAERQALLDRRRKARLPGATESEAIVIAAATDLDDRQHLLDDQRRLDTMRQDTVSYFRNLYLVRCNGRSL